MVEMFYEVGDTYAKHLSRADERYDLVFYWLEKCIAVSLALLFPARPKPITTTVSGGCSGPSRCSARRPSGITPCPHRDSMSAAAGAGLSPAEPQLRPKEGVAVLTQCAIFNALALLSLSRFHLLAYKLNEARLLLIVLYNTVYADCSPY